jgi:hypothetical protein
MSGEPKKAREESDYKGSYSGQDIGYVLIRRVFLVLLSLAIGEISWMVDSRSILNRGSHCFLIYIGFALVLGSLILLVLTDWSGSWGWWL